MGGGGGVISLSNLVLFFFTFLLSLVGNSYPELAHSASLRAVDFFCKKKGDPARGPLLTTVSLLFLFAFLGLHIP